jgi:hypothetical protein
VVKVGFCSEQQDQSSNCPVRTSEGGGHRARREIDANAKGALSGRTVHRRRAKEVAAEEEAVGKWVSRL